ncbi:MAG: electron transfer flavoprotein subunit alpha [bacterium]|nr:electron transfer flavoprotein subunit alpha [Candidatus Sumerlaeota bacterium]
METILFLAFTDDEGKLAKAQLETLTAARLLTDGLPDAVFCAGFIGGAAQPAADQIAACGAGRFLAAAGEDFSQPRYATDAEAAEALARAAGATIILSAGVSRWSRIAGGVAHRIGGRADTHATMLRAANGAPEIQRWYYRQRMIATIQRKHRPWVISVDPGCFEPWTGQTGTASIKNVAVAVGDGDKRTRFESFKAPAANQQTIRPDAELLLVAGAGWTKKQRDGQIHVPDAEKLILGFLDKTQASLGGSKSLVDQSGDGNTVLSFMTHLNQIGQTGATPRHPKGLATCCHGEEPHVVGWRFVTQRRAVNLDPNCGWAHGKADVLYVTDAFEVMTKVNELLQKQT